MSTVLESCRVTPPPATVKERSLPLTFFDMMWLIFIPVHQVFFYEIANSREHFLETVVPNLKHSLSITLQHFFPFAGNLIVFLNPCDEKKVKKPEIRYIEGDSVAVSFVECSLDFNDLTGNHPGISIGLSNHHSLCDGSARSNFLNAWTSIARHGTDEFYLASGSLPFYDRVIKYPSSLDEIYMSQPGLEAFYTEYQPHQLVSQTDKVRATIVLTQAHINRLKKSLSTQLPPLEYISSFSVACAFVWSCLAKSRVDHVGEKKRDDDLERLICAFDWRSRMDPPVPQTYFGNCVGPCITSTTSTLLQSERGFYIAAELFGKALSETIKNKDGMLKDAETWLGGAFDPVLTTGVLGTPKTKIYDVDFGWGKPKKHETISIDYNGSISVNACKDSPVDIEIGLCLPAKQMDAFLSISQDTLDSSFL